MGAIYSGGYKLTCQHCSFTSAPNTLQRAILIQKVHRKTRHPNMSRLALGNHNKRHFLQLLGWSQGRAILAQPGTVEQARHGSCFSEGAVVSTVGLYKIANDDMAIFAIFRKGIIWELEHAIPVQNPKRNNQNNHIWLTNNRQQHWAQTINNDWREHSFMWDMMSSKAIINHRYWVAHSRCSKIGKASSHPRERSGVGLWL